jgi:hypothetical protein
MNEYIKQLLSDKIIWWGTVASGVLFLFSLFYVVIFYHRLPSLVPVYNQLPWGPSRLGQKYELFVPLLVTLAIFLGNLFFSRFLYERMPLVARMINVTTMLINVLTLIFLVHIVQLII